LLLVLVLIAIMTGSVEAGCRGVNGPR